MHGLGPPAPAEDRHNGHKFWTAPHAHHEIVSSDYDVTETKLHGCVSTQSAGR